MTHWRSSVVEKASRVGEGLGVVGIPLSDPLDDSPSSEVGDSKLGIGGRGKSKVSSSLEFSACELRALRRHSESPWTAVNSCDVRGIARSETPRRRLAFMLFFFVFLSVNGVFTLSAPLDSSESSKMLASPTESTVLLRMARDWRLIYEDTIQSFLVRKLSGKKGRDTHSSSS